MVFVIYGFSMDLCGFLSGVYMVFEVLYLTLCQIERCDVEMMNWGSKRIEKQAHICHDALPSAGPLPPPPSRGSTKNLMSTPGDPHRGISHIYKIWHILTYYMNLYDSLAMFSSYIFCHSI